MESDYREPVYTIGVVARKLKVCQATLRIWEKKQLIKPARIGKDRFFSRCDLDRLGKIKELIQIKKINIEGVRSILGVTNCWDIKNCGEKERNACSVYKRFRATKNGI